MQRLLWRKHYAGESQNGYAHSHSLGRNPAVARAPQQEIPSPPHPRNCVHYLFEGSNSCLWTGLRFAILPGWAVRPQLKNKMLATPTLTLLHKPKRNPPGDITNLRYYCRAHIPLYYIAFRWVVWLTEHTKSGQKRDA